jgi:hypothetical protein
MRYEVTTGLTPREALEQATAYFGRGGVGLQAIAQTPHSLVFQGGGGHVAITVKPDAITTLALETREWDVAVQQFMRQVSRRPRWWSRWWRRKRAAAPPSAGFTILNNAPADGAGR